MGFLRRNAVPLFVTILSIVGVICAYAVYQTSVAPRFARDRAVLESKSAVRLSMEIRYASGPLISERWQMADVEGTSTCSYRSQGRNGVVVTIAEQPRRVLGDSTNVAYLFGKLVQDGIWDLPSRPDRGDTNARYTVYVYQLIAGQHGDRTFTFTDPHYWAVTAGHQFHIVLHKGRPLPDILHMTSTTQAQPGYQSIVDDFRAFGPPSFHARIAAEKRRRYGIAS